MRTLALALAACAVLGVLPAPAAAAHDGRVDTYLRQRMAATKTPGMAYAVVSGDAVLRRASWGHDGDGQPVTESTPFLWGSVAKPVTATAVMTLVESGKVDLDEPVRRYLPSFALADDRTAAAVTVRHLLEHTSGIPEGTGVTDRFDQRPDPYREAVADLAGVAPLSPPGERFGYASENYLVLGAVVESVTGQPFHRYLRGHVLGPLGMRDTVTTPERARDALPGGHGYAFGQPVALAARYDSTGPSYGYLGGSVDDLARFAMAHLNGGRNGSTRVLDGSSVDLMHHGTARVTDTQRYGLGWRDDRSPERGTRTVWHAGAAPGYQAMVVLLPRIDRGVVVLQNVYGNFQDAPLLQGGFGAARMLAGATAPEPEPGDTVYPLLLAGLTAVLCGAVAAVAVSVRGLLRPSRTRARRRRVLTLAACWVLCGLTLAYVASVVVPASSGASLRIIRLFAPDVGWLLSAVAAAGLALAVTWVARAAVDLRRARHSRGG